MKRTLRLRPALLAALTLSFALLVAGSVSAGARRSVRHETGRASAPTGDTRSSTSPPTACGPTWSTSTPRPGAMPTMKPLMRQGVKGKNGLLPGLPAEHRRRLVHALTGTWPGEHGSTNNTFHRVGEGNFNNSTSFATTGILQADHIGQSAERSGQDRRLHGVGRARATSSRRSRARSSTSAPSSASAASCSTTTCPASPPARTRSASQYQRIDLADAAGWTNVPASFSPAKQTSFTHNNSQIPRNGVWDVYIYDSTNDGTTNYDRVLIVSAADGQERRHGRREPRPGRVGRRQGDARVRHVRGPDGRLLRQAIDLTGRPVEVPPLLHVGAARERDLQRARRLPARPPSRRS